MAEGKLNTSITPGDDIFKIAVENTPTGVCITNEFGFFEYVNKSFCSIYEYTPEELIGKNFTIVVPDEHKNAMQALHDKYIDGIDEVRGEWDVITKNKNRLTILADAVRVHGLDGHLKKVTFVTDITERKKYEQELQKFYVSIETASSSISITDSNGSISYANPSFFAITEYSRDEVIGKNSRIVKSGVHDEQFYKSMWDTISSGKTWKGDICNKNKRGELFWESTVITPITDDNGRIVNYVAIKNDISKKLDLDKLKEDVGRILQHDLRTPLNSIIALPQLIKSEGRLTVEQINDLNYIETSGLRMLRMINSSLDIFKMENGTYFYDPSSQDLISIARNVAKDIQADSGKTCPNIVITINSKIICASDEFIASTEETNFHTMLSNLLLNAIEASSTGNDVFVNFQTTPPKKLTIVNKGAVPKSVREHFFEKYKTYGKKYGTGLGTYSAKLIAEAMNYCIEMQTSDESNETLITITFPAKDGAP